MKVFEGGRCLAHGEAGNAGAQVVKRRVSAAAQRLHGAGGIAEVPREPVHARIDMARAAGDVAQAGVFMRVVQMLASDLDLGGVGSKKGTFAISLNVVKSTAETDP